MMVAVVGVGGSEMNGEVTWGGFIGGIYMFRRPYFSKIADIDIVLDGHGSRSVVGRAV